MSKFPITQQFIDTKPRFKLAGPTRPPKQEVIILECLGDAYPNCLTLDELVAACEKRRYRERFKADTDIRQSILWQLNRIKEVQACPH